MIYELLANDGDYRFSDEEMRRMENLVHVGVSSDSHINDLFSVV